MYGAEATKSYSNAKGFHTVTNSSPISSHDLSLGSEFLSKSTPVSSDMSDHAVRVCVVCGMNHRLFYCDEFKGMRPEARLDIAIKNKLCYNCLLPGHNSFDCHKSSVCSVPECGRKHTKFIHVDNVSQTVNELVGNVTNSDNTAVQEIINVMLIIVLKSVAMWILWSLMCICLSYQLSLMEIVKYMTCWIQAQQVR